jgi:peptidyl-prolyl cis-trans isomerase SurA
MTKKIFFCLLILLGMVFPVYAKAKAQGAVAADLDKIVAIVNGDVITQRELDKKEAMISKQQPMTNDKVKFKAQVLDSMIYALLQLQLAQRNGIQVDGLALDNIISNIAKSNHITVDQLREAVQKHEGLSFKEYREQLREQVTITQVQQRFLGKEIVVNDQDIQKVLRNPPKTESAPAQYHVIDVLIETADNSSADQIEAANNIAKQVVMKLKQGVALAQIEQEYNLVHSNDLGWRKIDELPTLFVKEITKMRAGQIIGPLKAPNGLHLIRLLEVHGAQPQSAKLTKEQAQELAFRQKLEEKLKPWLKELREAAYVKVVK